MAQIAATAPDVAAAVERVSAELRTLIGLLSVEHSPSLDTVAAVEGAGRLMDAARVHAASPFSRNPVAAEKLGFASSIAAIASIAQVSQRTARERLTVAAGITPDLSISGAPLPAPHTQIASALDSGQIGVEAAALITKELDRVVTRVERPMLAAAETAMVNLASGLDPTGEHRVLPASVDYLAAEIRQIGAAIDPDGALPRERRAARRRSLRIGQLDEDGLVPMNGRLLPEIGLLLLGMVEALRRSPRFVDADELDERGEPGALGDSSDTRTPDQRRHDAFAEMLIAANAAKDAPQLDGQAVTVIVSVQADELSNPDGLLGDPIGTMAGSAFPVSRGQVERFIDAAGFREVYKTPQGRVVGISSPQRCFTSIQRLGMAARDGYQCITPGCTSKHIALQAHHVVPYRDGGPTSIGNGVLMCFDHHLHVDDGPWEYRMVDGLPEVRGPGLLEWTRARPGHVRAA